MSNKKRIVIMSLSVVLFIVLIFGVTYAIFNYTRTGDMNAFDTSTVQFTYTDNTLINVASDFPQDSDLSNAELVALQSTHGGSLNISGHNTLTNGVEYKIYVIRGDDISGKQRLSDSSIKFQLTPNFTSGANGFTVLTNNYSLPANLSFDNTGKALISTGLVKDTTQLTTVAYNYYMWIDADVIHISSTMKRATLAEGNPSLADTTSGNTTAGRYMKNDSTLTTVTLFPASSNESGKIIYTTNEFSNGYYNIKFLVVAEEYKTPICKRATSLHTETCSQSSNYCYADGYYSGGTMNTTTITYGNLGTSGNIPSTGDAFDCDVDGTGYNQRFYYVSPYYNTNNNTFDDTTGYATLIYYSNTVSGLASTNGSAYYGSAEENWHGPVSVKSKLPTASQWNNITLKTTERIILACSDANCSGANDPVTTTGGGSNTIEAFSYSGYAARLLTVQEVKQAGCDTLSEKTGLNTTGALKACNFLMEGTKYVDSTKATYGPWLETSRASNSAYVLSVNSYKRDVSDNVVTSPNSRGVRPTIDVPYSRIEY